MEVNEKEIFAGAKLIDDVSLIKVKVIKKKFVEQIETWWEQNIFPFDKVEYIGLNVAWILFRIDSKLWKIHFSRFVDSMRSNIRTNNPDLEYEDVNKLIEEVTSKIPQIFEE